MDLFELVPQGPIPHSKGCDKLVVKTSTVYERAAKGYKVNMFYSLVSSQ